MHSQNTFETLNRRQKEEFCFKYKGCPGGKMKIKKRKIKKSFFEVHIDVDQILYNSTWNRNEENMNCPWHNSRVLFAAANDNISFIQLNAEEMEILNPQPTIMHMDSTFGSSPL